MLSFTPLNNAELARDKLEIYGRSNPATASPQAHEMQAPAVSLSHQNGFARLDGTAAFLAQQATIHCSSIRGVLPLLLLSQRPRRA